MTLQDNENSRPPGEPSGRERNQQRSDFSLQALLDAQFRHGEHFTICSAAADGSGFQCDGVFTVDELDAAVAAASGLIWEGRNAWYGVNPVDASKVSPPERGGEEDVTRLADLVVDLDLDAAKCPDMATAEKIVTDLSEILSSRPTLIVHSGGGIQLHWHVEDGDHDPLDIKARWAQAVKRVAKGHRVKLDNVSDLSRVMRLPGSFNFKYGDGRPVDVIEFDPSRKINPGVLPQVEKPKPVAPQPSTPHRRAVDSGGCRWVERAAEGIATDPEPANRHSWLLNNATRVEAARAAGCLDGAGYAAARRVLEQRIEEWRHRDGKSARGEADRAFAKAEERVRGRTADELIRAELGDHIHPADVNVAPAYELDFAKLDEARKARMRKEILAAAKAHRGQPRYAHRLAAKHVGTPQFLHLPEVGWFAYDGCRYIEDRGRVTQEVLALLREIKAEVRAEMQPIREGMQEALDRLAALGSGKKDKSARDLLRAELREWEAELKLLKAQLADIETCESANGVRGTLALAEGHPVFTAKVDDLDADPWKMNVANGILDLKTFTLAEHDPAQRMTKIARAAHRDSVPRGRWADFIERVQPDKEVREYLQRLCGTALVGVGLDRILPILMGEGDNGKTIFYEAVAYAFGDYAVSVEPDILLVKDRQGTVNGLYALRGARFVATSETDDGRQFSVATMKRVVGNDDIVTRQLYQQEIRFRPSHTIFMATNRLPLVDGNDPAVWRRLRVIPFDVKIPEREQDPNLREKLEDAADEILAWCVEGLRDYLRRGSQLDAPQRVLSATDSYRSEMDGLSQFISERCRTGPDEWATAAGLYEKWRSWQQEEGFPPMSRKQFGTELRRRGFTRAHTMHGNVYRGITPLGLFDPGAATAAPEGFTL